MIGLSLSRVSNEYSLIPSIAGIVAIAAIVFSTSANAQGITPSHVFQVVDNVNGELALMHQANGSKGKKDKKAPALNPRKPRHVIQKAREVLLKVQVLRKTNGLSVNAVPTLPTREIVPADVKNVVTQILTDLRPLRKPFGVKKASPKSELTSGKNPTHVYGNLIKADLLISGLGIPRVVPNDVYQIGMTIVGDLKLIRKHVGINEELQMASPSKRQKPKHVFARGMEVLAAMKALSDANPKFAVPGGIILPNDRTGKVTPGHVIDLFNNVLADISAIKAKLGINVPTKLAPVASGKTPSNVFDAINTALSAVKSLQKLS